MSLGSFKRIAILGDTGFIGQALSRRLAERDVEVHGYSSRNLDLRNAEALPALDPVVGPDTCLIVLSGLTPDKGVTVQSLAANIAMVTNLAGYLEQHPVGQCVYFSSDAVYGFGDQPVNEATPVELSNFYALSKFTGEQVLQSVASAKGFPLLSLRPTGIFGPGDTHNSYGPNRFMRTIVTEGKVSMFGAGEETRDHVYLDDLVELTIALCGAGESGLLNVATGTSRTFGSIVDELRGIIATPFQVEELPRRGPITHRQFDVSRLTHALPDFRFTPFSEALRATCQATAR